MEIIFDDGTATSIMLSDSVARKSLLHWFKHLGHIDVPFTSSDWSEHRRHADVISLVKKLVTFADRLSVTVDQEKCLQFDQAYFNWLHLLFETQYNGCADWIYFHETIHNLEELPHGEPENWLKIDYRGLGGLLEEKFDRRWLAESVTSVKAGQVYCTWSELSKKPYKYWLDKEPNDINRICELCKPWLQFKPQLSIALSDINFCPIDIKSIDRFLSWWVSYQRDWCDHWQIHDWRWQEMFSVIPVGWCTDVYRLQKASEKQTALRRVKLTDCSGTKETLNFAIDIDTVWQSHPPLVEIKIDDQLISIGELQKGMNHITFDITLDHGEHILEMNRSGATAQDRSQMFTIDRVTIDHIDCQQLILRNSVFCPDYPEPWATQQRQQNCELPATVPFETVLGHNGKWTMSFQTPFYPYVLAAHLNQVA